VSRIVRPDLDSTGDADGVSAQPKPAAGAFVLRHADWLVAAALAGVSLAVTVPRAWSYALWQDEVGAARLMIRHGLPSLLRGVAATENHPPGYYALGWGIHQVGVPVVWERAFSVAAIAVLAAAVYLAARHVLTVTSAALAGLVVAVAWSFERHGWELRPYALLALVSFAGVYALYAAAIEPSRRRLALLTVVVAIGGLLHDFFVFTMAAGLLWLLVSPVPRERKRLLAAVALGLIPLALWTPGFVEQLRHSHFATLPAFNLRGLVDLYAELLERSVPAGTAGLCLSLAALALVVLGAVRLWRDAGFGRLVALAAVVPVGIAAVIWSTGPHIFVPRALIGVAPFAAIALGASLAVSQRPVALAATALAAALLVYGFARADGRITPDYDRVAASLVAEGWQPQDPILLFGSLYDYLVPLDWYLPGADRLEVAAPRANRCARVFVVAVGGRARSLTTRSSAPVRIRSVVVARLPWRAGLLRSVERRHGWVLGTRRSGCLRLVAP
jgi:hypothetical protein